MNFIEKVFGTHSDRELKRIMPLVDKVEALRPTMQALTNSFAQRRRNIRTDWQMERHWMICFQKHMPLSVRVQSVPLDWSTTVYRSSVVSFFTRDVSQR